MAVRTTCGTVNIDFSVGKDDVFVACGSVPDERSVGEPFTVSHSVENLTDFDLFVETFVVVGGERVERVPHSLTPQESRVVESEIVVDTVAGSQEQLDVTIELGQVVSSS